MILFYLIPGSLL